MLTHQIDVESSDVDLNTKLKETTVSKKFEKSINQTKYCARDNILFIIAKFVRKRVYFCSCSLFLTYSLTFTRYYQIFQLWVISGLDF